MLSDSVTSTGFLFSPLAGHEDGTGFFQLGFGDIRRVLSGVKGAVSARTLRVYSLHDVAKVSSISIGSLKIAHLERIIWLTRL